EREPEPAPAMDEANAKAEQAASILDTPTQIVVSQPDADPSRDELLRVIEQAGMQWVETDSAKLAAARHSMQESTIRLGREPRVRPPVVSEALIQVETRPELRT